MSVTVLFVCLGNICRSPTAHGVFEHKVSNSKLDQLINVDSAGTGDWHLGHCPDERASKAALKRGVDLSQLRARLVTAEDFSQFDYVLAMDNSNLSDLQAMAPACYTGHLGLFLDFAKGLAVTEVPDPYYGKGDGFEQVLDLVEQASDGLLQHIQRQHRL